MISRFRGKRLDNDRWIYGSLVKFDDSNAFIMPEYKGASTASYAEIFRDTAIAVDIDTVDQSTGLLDKNEKEIFERDICKFYGRFGIDTGVVEFQRYGFHIVLSNVSMYRIDEFWLEVIGSMNEDSHLL